MHPNSDQNSIFLQPLSSSSNKLSRKSCNCRNSKCLKLYCECFASGQYCRKCNCFQCLNIPQFQAYRTKAIHATLERNPTAFRPKIATVMNGKHTRGCACRKSSCLKKYCECFQAGINCSSICKCKECRNFQGCGDFGSFSSQNTPVKGLSPTILDGVEQYRQIIAKSMLIEPMTANDALYCSQEVLAADSALSQVFTYSAEYEAVEANLYEYLLEFLINQ